MRVPWNKTNIYKKCSLCKKEYRIPPSEAKRSKFCSLVCKSRFGAQTIKRMFSGKNSWMYKGNKVAWHPAKRYRNQARTVLKNECKRCGSLNNLIVHHVDGNFKNNPVDGSNWEILCRSCHPKEHPRERNKNGTFR